MATDVSRKEAKKTDEYPPPPPPPEPRKEWSTPEERAAFVRRVRDILTGKIPPEPMVTPPIIQAMVDEVKREHPQTIASSLRRIADDLNEEYHFGGHAIMCLETPKGRVVLAFGRAEVSAIQEDIPSAERQHVYTAYPHPWGYTGRV
jgi:hypothetical protein